MVKSICCIKKTFDKDSIRKIEQITKDDSENLEWFNHREGRIPASNFSSILSFKFTIVMKITFQKELWVCPII